MGHKVDISEVIELSDELKSASENIKSSLDQVKGNIDQINDLSSFSGRAAREAKNYFNEFHKTILESLNGLFDDLDKNLKKHLETFEANVDSNKFAIIQSDYLKDTEGEISDNYDDLYEKYESIKETIYSVEDISSASPPSYVSVNIGKNEANKVITNLDEKLALFTSEGDVSQTKDLLHQIEATMNKAQTKDGEARFTDFPGATQNNGLAALKDYNKGKEWEAEVEKAKEVKDEAIKNMGEPSQELVNQLYNALKNGEIDEAEFYSQLDNLKDLQSEEATFKGLQQKDKEQLVEENGDLVNVLQTMFGNDWYSRFTDMSSLAAFTTNFSKRFDDIEKNNPKAAAAMLKVLNQSDELTNFLRKTEDLTRKLKSNPTAAKYLGEFSKANTWLGALKDVGDNKYLKAGVDALRSGVDMVKDTKLGSAITSVFDSKTVQTFGSKAKGLLNKVGKVGPIATIASVGFNGYYNVRNEEVQQNFSEGQWARGSAKVAAGTAIDTVKNVGPIDGLIGGAMVGGVPGAFIGGAVGTANQLAQFIWPSGYDKIKSVAFQGIDWAADTVEKTLNSVKDFGSKAIDTAGSVAESIGNGVQSGLDSLKDGIMSFVG